MHESFRHVRGAGRHGATMTLQREPRTSGGARGPGPPTDADDAVSVVSPGVRLGAVECSRMAMRGDARLRALRFAPWRVDCGQGRDRGRGLESAETASLASKP